MPLRHDDTQPRRDTRPNNDTNKSQITVYKRLYKYKRRRSFSAGAKPRHPPVQRETGCRARDAFETKEDEPQGVRLSFRCPFALAAISQLHVLWSGLTYGGLLGILPAIMSEPCHPAGLNLLLETAAT